MLNRFRNPRVSGAVLGALFGCTALLSAQTPPTPSATAPARAPVAAPSRVPANGLFRASQLLGKDIVDATSATVGSLKDVAVETSGGLIAIVKRTDGELAGLPIEALTAQLDGKSDEPAKVKDFLLTASADKLGSAPLINDIANIDAIWLERVREHFAPAGDTAREDKPGETPMGDPTKPVSVPVTACCVDALIGMKVTGTGGADIGAVEELVVTLPDGKLAYAVISTGGMLGMGGTPRGVAWKSLTLDTSGKHFELVADKAAIEKLPAVDYDHLAARPDLEANATSPAGMGPVAQEPTR